MPSYKAPLQDMFFILEDVFNLADHCQQIPFYQHIDPDIFEPVLEEAAKFTENNLLSINQSGDLEACQFENGQVYTPSGFKNAYQRFVSDGWLSLNADPEFGGQGLPKMLQVFLDEMLCSTNVSFSLYTVLTQGAYHLLHLHGSDQLKQAYLPKLVSGVWSGTMCLTESHAGSDLSLIRTKAVPQQDDTYKISGTKIFITSGEHDLTENIIHMVLARLPDAPPGVKGISVFLVPKYLINSDGSLGDRNAVFCGSIEHKMGIKASSTCVMNFEDATGYLIGKLHHGIETMFSMMNLERLNIGLEGLGLAEIAYQNALTYAKERKQGRSGTHTQSNKEADPLICHPDIRKMLLSIKSFTEGARMMAAWIANQIDITQHHTDPAQIEIAENIVSLLTPVVKAFFTDHGFYSCNLALQIFGGHGYIREWGIEQYVRDARISQIYEGTNGIQAIDLIKRKLIANKGKYIQQLITLIEAFMLENPPDFEFNTPLKTALTTLNDVSAWILKQSDHTNLVGGAAVDYLKLVGLVVFAYLWALSSKIALEKHDKNDAKDFYSAKIQTAR
ncbi:MAG: acyl-CoA dehydrogenase family protein, partial [Gammaproteobacteria bacterium]